MPDVVSVRALGGHRVHLEFADGVRGDVDLGELITFRGVFASLRDAGEFARVRVDSELGTIVWPSRADMSRGGGCRIRATELAPRAQITSQRRTGPEIARHRPAPTGVL